MKRYCPECGCTMSHIFWTVWRWVCDDMECAYEMEDAGE